MHVALFNFVALGLENIFTVFEMIYIRNGKKLSYF